MKKTAGFVVMLLLLCLFAVSLAEVRVETGSGRLNMRTKMDEKSRVVTYVPNHALVMVTESGEEWTGITYRGKSGYVQTKYLLLPEFLSGQVYPDEGCLFLQEVPGEDAGWTGVCGELETVEILSLEGDFFRVRNLGALGYGAEGYVSVTALSYQRKEVSGTRTWIPERGRIVRDTVMTSGGIDGLSVPAGTEVRVGPGQGEMCLVQAGDLVGYIPVSDVALLGLEEDRAEVSEECQMAEEIARTALGKKFRSFAREKLYALSARWEDGVLCTFYSEEDQYRYACLVKNGKASMSLSYTDFALPVRVKDLLPMGQMEVTVSDTDLGIGDVAEIRVRAYTDYRCRYILTQEGKTLVDTGDTEHFHAAWRARKPGRYELLIRVTDEQGESLEKNCVITVADWQVSDAEPGNIYSQKDGWWLDKAYRKSTLDQSGCAIFTLSHVLHRMGITGKETEPETLAVTYALCLTVDGTNNERLIRTAAEDFGFKTQRALLKNAEDIRRKLREGCFFSFSVARGHIAMIGGISEDGNMVLVVDSAPSATFERKVGTDLYYRTSRGAFRVARSLEDLPGAVWFLDTDKYGGMEYWMPLSYVAKRGVRLIEPADTENHE